MPLVIPADSASQALDIASARGTLPTWMSTGQMRRKVAASVRRRAVYSARMTHATAVQHTKDVVDRVLKGGLGNDFAQGRLELRNLFRRLGYTPETGFPGDEALGIPPARPGSLKDLTSDRRLNLILNTQMQLMRGVAQKTRGMDGTRVKLFPAWELVRYAPRRNERDWPARFRAVGYDLPVDGEGRERLVAVKGSPVWAALGNSALFDDALDVDHPPFAFESGMGWLEVHWDEAEKIGLDLSVAQAMKTPRDVESIMPPARASDDHLDPDLKARLRRALEEDDRIHGKLPVALTSRPAPVRAAPTSPRIGLLSPAAAKKAGIHGSAQALAKLTRLVPRATVEDVFKLGSAVAAEGHVSVRLKGDGVQLEHWTENRYARRDLRTVHGVLQLHNDYFRIEKAGKGEGSRAFVDQVEAAARLGIDHLDTWAVRSKSFNGYYTWPRFGYDGVLEPRHINRVKRELGADVTTVQDLFAVPGGIAWWEKRGASIDLQFDLAPDSLSMRAMKLYMAEAAAKRAAKKAAEEAAVKEASPTPAPALSTALAVIHNEELEDDDRVQRGDELNLSPEEDRELDEFAHAWAAQRRKEEEGNS